VFAPNVQSHPRGRQNLDLPGRFDDVTRQPHALQQVLIIVQNEQQVPPLQKVEQLLLRCIRSGEPETQGIRHSGHDGLCRLKGGEGDEIRAVLILA
jgi:hypothetical protein